MKHFLKNTFSYAFAIAILGCGFVAVAQPVNAANPSTGIFSSEGKLLKQLSQIPKDADVTAANIIGDDKNEIIVGSTKGTTPSVTIYNSDGQKISRFVLKNVRNKPSVQVAVGDVTGDNEKDIVIAFGEGSSPDVRIYKTDGTLRNSFVAVGKGGFTGGLQLTLLDRDGDGVQEICVSPISKNASQILVYSANGKLLSKFDAYAYATKNGFAISTNDVTGDGIDDVVTATKTNPTHVKVFSGNGNVIAGFKKSATPSAIGIDETSHEILLATSSKGKAYLESVTLAGKKGAVSFAAFTKSFGDEASVTLVDINGTSDPEIVVAPGATIETNPQAPKGKYILIDISDQRMRQYVDGVQIAERRVSTGKWSMPTPLGNFKVQNKISTAYSAAYRLYMDNWMAITPDGKYGIHSLPYWKLKNGSYYYEGVDHLGVRVSHGCVRLSPQESKEVFQWATVGTPIKIQD